MIFLYHAPTAVCAAKVRIVLAEKQLAFEGRLINLTKGEQFNPDYIKLNPNAAVPTLVHDGQVLIESTVINEYLDEAFAAYPLRPTSAFARAQMHLWTRKEDLIHDAINTMTASIVFRHELLLKSKEQQLARYSKIPDPAKRDKWHRMIEEGLNSSITKEALSRFASHFIQMERSLSQSKWLMGDQFSLADAGLVSFFYRLEMLEIAHLWEEYFPQVSRWYQALKARSSFKVAILDYVSVEDHDKYQRIARPLSDDVRKLFAPIVAGVKA